MASDQLTNNFVKAHLKDDVQISPNTTEKIIYFREAINKAYPTYKKTFGNKARTFTSFAELVLKRHSHNIRHKSIEFQQTYFKDAGYIDRLIKDTFKAEEAKTNPDHAFTRDEYVDPVILQFENLIDRRYNNLLKVECKTFDNTKATQYDLSKRLFEQLISGLILLEREAYNDSFILWRSLLETTTTFLILIKHPEFTGKYIERKRNALMRINIINAGKNALNEKSREAEKHLGDKNVAWYIRERFGWAGPLLVKKEYNLKTLLEAVNIVQLHPHYSFASLFVHEYLINPSTLKMEIDFQKYLLTLYFRLYESVRVQISDTFTNDLKDAKKLEEGIRTEVRNFNSQFNDFSTRIVNA